MAKIQRVNWVICPKCKNRYYVGAPLLMVEGIPAICPKCRHEFDAQANLDIKTSLDKAAIMGW